MSLRTWIESARTRLDITAGMTDGVLTALTLASGKLLRANAPVASSIAFKIGAATALTTLFVFFVAHYAELRTEIDRAEKQLNLLRRGTLAAGELGRRAVANAFAGSLLAAACGLLGSMVPLLLCFALPTPRWLGLAITIGLLGLLGAAMARSFRGPIGFWAVVLMLGGVVLAWIGWQLDIAG
jgi:predicted membrane protein (TIGR00267 family)